jgi:hypothetical protein
MKLIVNDLPYTVWTKHNAGHGWIECILKNADGVAERAVTLPSWFIKSARKGSSLITSGNTVKIA